MRMCEWETVDGKERCMYCHASVPLKSRRRWCDTKPPGVWKETDAVRIENGKVANISRSEPDGLGDRIENWLSSHGITEDRYKEIKQKFGLPANCGCGKRKQWFNKVGAYLGISADTYGPNKETK